MKKVSILSQNHNFSFSPNFFALHNSARNRFCRMQPSCGKKKKNLSVKNYFHSIFFFAPKERESAQIDIKICFPFSLVFLSHFSAPHNRAAFYYPQCF
jgi:hypothetical protein